MGDTMVGGVLEPLQYSLRFGSLKYRSFLQVSHYREGGLALVAWAADTFEMNGTLSVNLPGVPAADWCIWVKDYSENEGIWDSLIEHGLIEPTGRTTHSGWVTLQEARLLGPALDAAVLHLLETER